jgi:hypothetical protein
MAYDPRNYNASDLMSMPQEDLPKPKNPPTGHYYGQIMSYSRGPTPWNKENTESIFYTCQIMEPADDVSPEEVVDLDLRSFRLQPIAYEISPDRIADLRKLHASLGLNQKNSSDQNVPEAVGCRVLMNLTTKPSTRPGDDREFTNIASMVGAE